MAAGLSAVQRSVRVRLSGLRAGLVPWMLLAAVGWGVAGVAVVVAIRAHHAAGSLAAAAALAPVSGPGVEVVIAEMPNRLAPPRPEPVRVQAGDLVLLNMTLWYAGARAAAVNGERITAMSPITASGPVILINGRPSVGPFRLVAIGDPVVLAAVLNTPGGIVQRMRADGLAVQVAAREDLTAPPWNPDVAP